MKIATLTIVIPCYNIINNDKYLNELLNIILKQKASVFNIQEILLINDSPEFNLSDFIFKENGDIKLRIITNVLNSGQAFSRNVGLHEVKSEYVHFIDQDDLIDSSFYYNIKKLNDIIITNCYLFNEDKSCKHSKLVKDFILNRFSKIRYLSFFLIFDNIVLSPGQVIFKTENLIKTHGFPELKKYGSDDYGLMYNLSNTDLNYSYSDRSIFYHRLHEVQGKKFLDMTASKNEFLDRFASGNFFFVLLCKKDNYFFRFLKKTLYLMFYKRI